MRDGVQWNLEFLRPAQDWELERLLIFLSNSIPHGLGWAGKTVCWK